MTDLFSSDALLRALPLLYLAPVGARLAGLSTARMWQSACTVCFTALALTVLTAAATILGEPGAAARPDKPGLTMALLVTLLGSAVTLYSRRYLHGEESQPRYIAALLSTLAAVTAVVLTDNLGALVLAWSAASIALHFLLTFYADRPAALVTAHKKFLASRLAEIFLAAALLLIYRDAGSLSVTALEARLAALAELPWELRCAAALIALAVIFKSAQLPVHGWLMQVMEAPTPVSALLHAGVVNLGGFVVIRLAALFSASPGAQALLVIAGSLTGVLAGLVMMTRVSIKVRLAWSTCAQMGFMLMECGLGLYDLALLHLVAHSLYKAYAFLAAGDAVVETRRKQLLPESPPAAPVRRLAARLAAAPLAVAIMSGSAELWHALFSTGEIPASVVLIVGLGLAPLLWRMEEGRIGALAAGALGTLALAQLYMGWHFVFGLLAGSAAAGTPAWLLGWSGASFAALYGLQSWLTVYPQGRLSELLYPWAYAGFYLDERFTRITFRVWPARLPAEEPGYGPGSLPLHVLTGEQA